MILPLTQDRLADVHRPNEPFPIIGRVIPSLTEGEWGYREELFDTPGTKCYPDEERDYSLYINSPDRAVFWIMRGKPAPDRSSFGRTGTGTCLWRISAWRPPSGGGESALP